MATQPRYEGQPAQPIGPRPGAMPGTEPLQLTGAQWGPVLAGAFAAIAALLILLTLGGAVGTTIGAAPSPAQGIGVGAAIWGAIVVIVSYLLAGWITGHTARPDRTSTILALGALAWIVSGFLLMVPMVLGLGNLIGGLGGGLAGGVAGLIGQQPGVLQGLQQIQPPAVQGEQVAGIARNVLWVLLLSQVLGVGSAMLGAYLAHRSAVGRRVHGVA